MRLKIIDERPDFMELEVSGIDVSIIDILSEKLNSSSEVEYCGYREEHPLTGVITVTMKTRPGSAPPRELLMKGLRELDILLGQLSEEAEKL